MRSLVVFLLAPVLLLFSAVPASAEERPPPPTSVAADVEPDGGVVVSWASVADAAGYNVYRDGEYLTTVEATTHVDAAGRSGTRYYVTSFDDSREVFSERSAEVSVPAGQPDPDVAPDADDVNEDAATDETPTEQTPNDGSLPAPTDLRFQLFGSNQGALVWDEVPGAAGYNVYRNDVFDRSTATPGLQIGLDPASWYVIAYAEGGAAFSPRSLTYGHNLGPRDPRRRRARDPDPRPDP